MTTAFRSSFTRDLRKIRDAAVRERVRDAILAVEQAPDLRSVPKLKKLSGSGPYFRISTRAEAMIADGRNTALLSVASAWEIAVKAGVGRVPLPGLAERFIPEQLQLNRIEILPIALEHALAVERPRGGIRGKYAARYAEGVNVVHLDPAVAAMFPDSEAVNRALRAIAGIIQERTANHEAA